MKYLLILGYNERPGILLFMLFIYICKITIQNQLYMYVHGLSWNKWSPKVNLDDMHM